MGDHTANFQVVRRGTTEMEALIITGQPTPMIGDANLSLSQKRAAAVKHALGKCYGISDSVLGHNPRQG